MNRKVFLMSVFGMAVGLITAFSADSLHADEKPTQKEHAAAESDHVAWLKQLRSMRADHQRALAAIKRLEAEILEHEAELEEQIAEIEEHRDHIQEHEAAIAGGETKESKAKHEELEKRHAEIAKAVSAAHEDHKDLISGLMKFAKEHINKFHTHTHE